MSSPAGLLNTPTAREAYRAVLYGSSTVKSFGYEVWPETVVLYFGEQEPSELSLTYSGDMIKQWLWFRNRMRQSFRYASYPTLVCPFHTASLQHNASILSSKQKKKLKWCMLLTCRCRISVYRLIPDNKGFLDVGYDCCTKSHQATSLGTDLFWKTWPSWSPHARLVCPTSVPSRYII